MRCAPLALVFLSSASTGQVLLDEPFDALPANSSWTGVILPAGGTESLSTGSWNVVTTPMGSGIANRSPCFFKTFDAGTAPISAVVRWSGTASASTPGGFYPLILQSPANTIAEAIMVPRDGGFVATMQCVNRVGVFVPCTGSRLFAPGAEHVIELSLSGANTSGGSCRLAVDGVEECTLSQDWTGLAPISAYVGVCAVEVGLPGRTSLDELRIAVGPQATRLRIRSVDGSMLSGGACTAFEIMGFDTFTAVQAPFYIPVIARLAGTTGIVATYADANCALSETSQWTVPPDGGSVFAYARLENPSAPLMGLFQLEPRTFPLPATALFRVFPGPSLDGGQPDAGASDSGVSDSGVADSGVADSGVADSGVADSGVADSGVADSGVADSGVADSGVADSGVADSGVSHSDAGTGLPGTFTIGCGCNAAAPSWGIVALALVRRFRRRASPSSGGGSGRTST